MLRDCKICRRPFHPEGSNNKVCPACQRKKASKVKNKKKGSIRLNHKGYVLVYLPKHPMSASSGYVLLHRLVMAKHVGRILKRKEVVHHIDGNKLNNKLANLELIDYRLHNEHHANKVKPHGEK